MDQKRRGFGGSAGKMPGAYATCCLVLWSEMLLLCFRSFLFRTFCEIISFSHLHKEARADSGMNPTSSVDLKKPPTYIQPAILEPLQHRFVSGKNGNLVAGSSEAPPGHKWKQRSVRQYNLEFREKQSCSFPGRFTPVCLMDGRWPTVSRPSHGPLMRPVVGEERPHNWRLRVLVYLCTRILNKGSCNV